MQFNKNTIYTILLVLGLIGSYFYDNMGSSASGGVSQQASQVKYQDAKLEGANLDNKSYIAPAIYQQFKDRVKPKAIRHILVGEPNNVRSGGHRYGIGRAGKSEFPKNWSDTDIFNNILSVVDDKSSKVEQQGRRQVIEGTRNGIDIRVIIGDRGDIITAYPTNVKRNPKY